MEPDQQLKSYLKIGGYPHLAGIAWYKTYNAIVFGVFRHINKVVTGIEQWLETRRKRD